MRVFGASEQVPPRGSWAPACFAAFPNHLGRNFDLKPQRVTDLPHGAGQHSDYGMVRDGELVEVASPMRSSTCRPSAMSG